MIPNQDSDYLNFSKVLECLITLSVIRDEANQAVKQEESKDNESQVMKQIEISNQARAIEDSIMVRQMVKKERKTFSKKKKSKGEELGAPKTRLT